MTAEYRCPECGSNKLRIEVVQEVVVRFDDDDDHEVIGGPEGDVAFNNESTTTCTGCDLTGTLLDFDAER